MTRTFRIAFVHESYSPYREKFFSLLSDAFDIEYFFLNEDPRRLPENSLSLRAWRIPRMSDFVVAPGLAGALHRAHRANPFDLIVCPEPSTFSAYIAWRTAKDLRLPYLVWSGEWMTAEHPRRSWMRPIERQMISGADACVAYGKRAAERLEAYGARSDRIFIAGNASPYAFKAPDAQRIRTIRETFRIGELPVVLFLGRLIPFKAPDVLLTAFAEVQRTVPSFLVIAGSGPMLSGLKRQAHSLAITRIHFTGKQVRDDEEKDLLYGLANVFTLPSRKARAAEPWGLVVNEAASAGLPIVASDHVGATGDLIEDGENGTVVKEGDPLDLAAAISRYLLYPDLGRIHGRRARQAVQRFTVERMADVFSQAMRFAVTGKRSEAK